MTDSLLPISCGHLSASGHDKAVYRYSYHPEHGSESNAKSYRIQPYQEEGGWMLKTGDGVRNGKAVTRRVIIPDTVCQPLSKVACLFLIYPLVRL